MGLILFRTTEDGYAWQKQSPAERLLFLTWDADRIKKVRNYEIGVVASIWPPSLEPGFVYVLLDSKQALLVSFDTELGKREVPGGPAAGQSVPGPHSQHRPTRPSTNLFAAAGAGDEPS